MDRRKAKDGKARECHNASKAPTVQPVGNSPAAPRPFGMAHLDPGAYECLALALYFVPATDRDRHQELS